jgi:subfamily B ATP-binding cassette protein MsbA
MRCRPNSWKGFRVAVADDRTQDPGHLDTIRWLWRGYLRPQWKLIAVAFGLMMIEGGSVAVIAWMVGPMFDGVFIGADYAAAVWVGVVVFGAFLARASAGFGQRVAMAQVGQRAIARIQGDLVAHMMSLDNAWFQINPPGTLIERVRGDTQVMATIWAVGLSAAGRDLIMLFALLGVALARDWLLALVAMAAAPLLVLPVTLLQRWVRDVSQRAREAAARVSTRLDEIFHGVTTIKLNTSETRDSERLAREIDALRRAQVRSAAGQAAIPALMDLAAGIGFLGVLTYGGLQIIDGRMTVGELTSFLAATALLFEPLRRLGQVTGQWQAARASLDRLQAVFAERPTIQSPACPRPVSDVARPPDIRFEDVHFAYADLPALDGLTFTAEAGQRTALVGASGAGKSTVFNLLSRLADPQRGQIRLGGVDIATLDLAALRGMFAVVSQDTALFDDPLRENIRFGEVAEWSKAHAWNACRRETVSRVRIPVSPPGRSGGFWGALPARSGVSWRGAVGPMAAIARRRRAAPTIRGAHAAGASASWPKAARFTASCMTTLYICAGLPSRSRRDCGACTQRPFGLREPRDHLCGDLRAAARRAEGGHDRGPAPGQTVARPPAHHAGGQRHRSGIIEDYPPARGDRGPAGARTLGR